MEHKYEKYVLQPKRELFICDFEWESFGKFKSQFIKCLKNIDRFLSGRKRECEVDFSFEIENKLIVVKPYNQHLDSALRILSHSHNYTSYTLDPIIYKNLFYHLVNKELVLKFKSQYKATEFGKMLTFINNVHDFIKIFPPNYESPQINDIFRKTFKGSIKDLSIEERLLILKEVFPDACSVIFEETAFNINSILLFNKDTEEEAMEMKMKKPTIKIYKLK